MVERDGPMSLSRQCELLGVGRASLYREPAGESAANLALMRRIDELYMDCPFAKPNWETERNVRRGDIRQQQRRTASAFLFLRRVSTEL